MNQSSTSFQTTFGFLSVEEIEGVGHCGGLLVVTEMGRPLEFHCCAPVSVNRAHSILYGKTYESFLYGEQIGLSLIEKAKTEPQLYLANRAELLVLNKLASIPTVLVTSRDDKPQPGNIAKHRHDDMKKIDLPENSIWCVDCGTEKIASIRTILGSFTRSLPLDEPFERIQKAMDEAQAVAR